MPTPDRNSRLQVLTTVTDRHVVPVIDLDRPDLRHLAAPASGAAGSGELQTTVPTGTTQALSGTGALGAINLTSYLTTIDTTGAATATLAAATTNGLTKRIRMIGDLGDCVITVSGTGVTSITLNDVNDQVDLIWDGAGWVLLDNVGATVS